MLNFKKYLVEQELLNEKLLLINNGKRYGQIVFLAGGAGSGKGFAGENFINIQDFKVRDVDEMKKSFISMNKLKHKYPELDGISLRNPKDVLKLHAFVDSKEFKSTGKNLIDTSMINLIKGMKNPETLPNIVFDVTLKNIKKINKTLPDLLDQGYKPENIHIVWVLTDYDIAYKANLERPRVVPYGDDGTPNIILQTHEGAGRTMWDIVGKGNIPKDVNGGIYVILNNRDQTVVFKSEDGKDYRSAKDNPDAKVRKTNVKKGDQTSIAIKTGKTDKKGNPVVIIKDFTYLTYKEPGKSPKTDKDIYKQLSMWVTNNVPKSTFKKA